MKKIKRVQAKNRAQVFFQKQKQEEKIPLKSAA
jgi:hypothetical protein